MIRSAGNLKSIRTRKNRLLLRGAVGVWNRESGDYIKGCDGAGIHAVGSLAGAGGWSITNVAAFSFVRSRTCASLTGLHADGQFLLLLGTHLPFLFRADQPKITQMEGGKD